MPDLVDKFIEDIVKNAGRSPFTGKPQAITVARENRGREEKLASLPMGLSGALLKTPIGGAALGAGVGGLASLISGDDHPLRDAAIGAGVGGLHGHLGSQLGRVEQLGAANLAGESALARDPSLDALRGDVRQIARSHENAVQESPYGVRKTDPVKEHPWWDPAGLVDRQHKRAALQGVFVKGVNDALARFGIKEAFLPMLGAIAGPMLARAGAGALARGAGGAMLGRAAGAIAPRIAGGMGGMAFDQAASMGGQALGQKLMPRQPQPPAVG